MVFNSITRTSVRFFFLKISRDQFNPFSGVVEARNSAQTLVPDDDIISRKRCWDTDFPVAVHDSRVVVTRGRPKFDFTKISYSDFAQNQSNPLPNTEEVRNLTLTRVLDDGTVS